jgi:lipoprotein-anchoring transpeptidase ErfK/SrfK
MKQGTEPIFLSPSTLRRGGSMLLAMVILASSVSTSSAIGKRHKPWKRSADRVVAPSANVASSTTRRGFTIFQRERRTETVAQDSAGAQTSQRVAVQATAGAEPGSTKRRGGLLARIFRADPDRRGRGLSANVAAVRQNKYQASPQPNPVQAPPSYNHTLISQAKSKGSSVVVNIAQQRAYVYVDGQVAIDSPVSTARAGKQTPRGSFGVGEKVRQGKISTIYHVDMPYWMRLGSSPYGMHAGYLPGYPASAGCIRLPYEAAAKIYDCVGYGTRVKIISG